MAILRQLSVCIAEVQLSDDLEEVNPGDMVLTCTCCWGHTQGWVGVAEMEGGGGGS